MVQLGGGLGGLGLHRLHRLLLGPPCLRLLLAFPLAPLLAELADGDHRVVLVTDLGLVRVAALTVVEPLGVVGGLGRAFLHRDRVGELGTRRRRGVGLDQVPVEHGHVVVLLSGAVVQLGSLRTRACRVGDLGAGLVTPDVVRGPGVLRGALGLRSGLRLLVRLLLDLRFGLLLDLVLGLLRGARSGRQPRRRCDLTGRRRTTGRLGVPGRVVRQVRVLAPTFLLLQLPRRGVRTPLAARPFLPLRVLLLVRGGQRATACLLGFGRRARPLASALGRVAHLGVLGDVGGLDLTFATGVQVTSDLDPLRTTSQSTRGRRRGRGDGLTEFFAAHRPGVTGGVGALGGQPHGCLPGGGLQPGEPLVAVALFVLLGDVERFVEVDLVLPVFGVGERAVLLRRRRGARAVVAGGQAEPEVVEHPAANPTARTLVLLVPARRSRGGHSDGRVVLPLGDLRPCADGDRDLAGGDLVGRDLGSRGVLDRVVDRFGLRRRAGGRFGHRHTAQGRGGLASGAQGLFLLEGLGDRGLLDGGLVFGERGLLLRPGASAAAGQGQGAGVRVPVPHAHRDPHLRRFVLRGHPGVHTRLGEEACLRDEQLGEALALDHRSRGQHGDHTGRDDPHHQVPAVAELERGPHQGQQHHPEREDAQGDTEGTDRERHGQPEIVELVQPLLDTPDIGVRGQIHGFRPPSPIPSVRPSLGRWPPR